MKLFNQIQNSKPKLNKFDLSHERKFSCNMGKMIPIMVQEVVPGDKFRVKTEILMRVAPMLAPVMHRVNVRTDYFFVPNRTIWNEWEDFITGGRLGTSLPVFPNLEINTTLLAAGYAENGTLLDYLGLPTTVELSASPNGTLTVSSLPFRAYQRIYNEYFRDPTLTPEVQLPEGSGNDNILAGGLMTLRTSCWEKDYFTSALPFAQRGGDVILPILGDSTDITYKPQSEIFKTSDGTTIPNNEKLGSGNLDPHLWSGDPVPADGQQVRIENIDGFSFDAADLTINVLRRAIKLQEWLEKNARGGYRYIEQIFSHFGVISSDARLQRPEYLGGGKNPMVISEVLSTFQADDGAIPQGNMAGHGIAVGNTHGFNKRFEEHGYVIGIMRVLPRTAYQDGVPRHWQRFDKLDHYWPEFAHLGEQEVRDKELFWSYEAVDSQEGTFGYQSRYSDYKFMHSSVHGDFKGNLAYWHMGRIFGAAPVLNTAFVEADPTHRIFPVTDPDVDKLYVQLYHRIDALRPMPYFGTPSI